MAKKLVIQITGDPSGLNRASREGVAAVQSVDRAQAQAARNIERESKRASDAQVRESDRAAKAAANGFNMAGSAANQFHGALTAVVGQFTVLAGAQAAMSSIGEMWKAWRVDALESAKSISGVREELLELAALKGRLGDTTTENIEQLKFRSVTLQSKDATRAFQGSALNLGQANVLSKAISQDEFDKAMILGGKFQATEGGDASTHGKLVGIIPALLKKKGITGEEVAAAEQKMFNIMQLGGFDFSSGAGQIIDKQSYTTGGTFKDPFTQTALQSMFSVASSPGESGTRLDQFIKGTTLALSNAAKGRVEGDALTQAQYLGGLGGKVGMEPQEIGKLIARDLKREETESAQARCAYDPMDYLKHKGYMDAEDRRAVMMFAAEQNSGRWGAFEARAMSPTGLTAEDEKAKGFVPASEMMKRFDTSPVADRRRIETMQGLEKTTTGLPRETYKNLQEAAFLSLKSRGEATGDSYEAYANSYFGGGSFSGAAKLDREIARQIAETAGKKGVKFDPGRLGEEFGDYSEWDSGAGRAKRFTSLQAEIDSAGDRDTTVMRTMTDALLRNADATTKQTKAIEDQRAGVVRPALPGAPAKVPNRNP